MPVVLRESVESQLILTDVLSPSFTADWVDTDLVRWCYASINKHFFDLRNGAELYIEGDERTFQDDAEFAELRIDGPFILIPQEGLYLIDVEINILCQTHKDPRNHYKAQQLVGVFTRAFKNTISVNRLGDGPFDDGSLIGCFHLQRDLRERIEINYYGIIREDTYILQTTIEGHYRLELWTKGE